MVESVERTNLISLSGEQKKFFELNGYLAVEGLITARELEYFSEVCDRFISGEIAIRGLNRGDLAGKLALEEGERARTLQILAPSLYCPGLKGNVIEQRVTELARQLLGADLALDFDQLLCKSPHSGRSTPWHQDQAYWPELPDTRATSCWVALDEATIENGCMQFIPGSHRWPVLDHRRAFGDPESRALETEIDAAAAVAVPLSPGSCVFHQGRTLHYTGPNLTAGWRRAYVVGCRPAAMIDLLRAKDFYHYVPDPDLDSAAAGGS